MGREVIIIIDPAASQRAQTDERSVADVFRAEGFVVKAARTNVISARISAGENAMTRMVDGKPALLIDPACTLLITALRSKYRYRMNTKGEIDDKPEKLHPWSDVVDAACYSFLQHDNGTTFGSKMLTQKRTIKKAPFRWAAA